LEHGSVPVIFQILQLDNMRGHDQVAAQFASARHLETNK